VSVCKKSQCQCQSASEKSCFLGVVVDINEYESKSTREIDFMSPVAHKSRMKGARRADMVVAEPRSFSVSWLGYVEIFMIVMVGGVPLDCSAADAMEIDKTAPVRENDVENGEDDLRFD
jgi:hypothetical protein